MDCVDIDKKQRRREQQQRAAQKRRDVLAQIRVDHGCKPPQRRINDDRAPLIRLITTAIRLMSAEELQAHLEGIDPALLEKAKWFEEADRALVRIKQNRFRKDLVKRDLDLLNSLSS
jgi:hypothetical protein